MIETRRFAVITGGSSGIGLELAKQFLTNGFDILIAADTQVQEASATLAALGPDGAVHAMSVDLATQEGVWDLYRRIQDIGRPVDALAANAGIGLGKSFLDEAREDWVKLINTNIIGTLDLIHLVGRDMRTAGRGRILITSSIGSQTPSPYLALYAASKVFLQSFSFAIRDELAGSGVTVTALLPGATDTGIWDRADVTDTKLGGMKNKDSAADVAKTGFEALMAGKGDVVHGFKNKLAVAATNLMPDGVLAKAVAKVTAPGTNK